MTSDPGTLYLELLKGCLTRAVFEDSDQFVGTRRPTDLRTRVARGLRNALGRYHLELVRKLPYDKDKRTRGLDWPGRAETMIGLRRLDNIEHCVRTVVAEGVPGDLIETGVWRGGALIFMLGVLSALGDTERVVWGADSFRGLPPPDAVTYPADAGDDHWTYDELAVSADDVKANVARYGLDLGRLRLLEGWFSQTLGQAPIDRLAVLRLDGDMYGSTWEAINPLYPKLSPGGFVIVDDYRVVRGCQLAIDDYRAAHGIDDEIMEIDGSADYWRRSA